MKKPFVVKTGKNPALIGFVFNLAEQAGYLYSVSRRGDEIGVVFNFSCDFQGFCEAGYEDWYDNRADVYGQVFDARTEMGKLLEFLGNKQEKEYIKHDDRKHEVIFNKDGSLKIGCCNVSSEQFERIAKLRTEAMK